MPLDIGGISHHLPTMKTTKPPTRKQDRKTDATVVSQYDAAVDAKKRISLRGTKVKHFHVKALSDGRYLLEPRVLVPPEAVSPRALKMLDESVANLKKGRVSPPIDLPDLGED